MSNNNCMLIFHNLITRKMGIGAMFDVPDEENSASVGLDGDCNGKRSKHVWSKVEDAKFVEALLYLVDTGWRSDNGTFRLEYLQHLERIHHEKVLGCALNQNTIECKVRSLKKQCNAVSEMLSQSGFDWNEEFKCVQVEREIFDPWVRSHPNAKGMWNKPFPHYDDLSTVFGKYKAVGQSSEDPYVMTTNAFREFEDEIRLGSQDCHTPESTHMGRLASWQKEKYELEFGRRKEVVNAIYNIDGLDEDDQVTLIDLLVTDIQKTNCFLAVPEHARKRYCLRLLGRNM
ncbi:uncharacterized protein LOC120083935 [Benincasa hispida]|uniref:uncharacterized protein LOC120083935 n=1 Tax=Benincasa hispida TaxID=102211 RepID=UPI0018FFE17E|nr:uncharacterized protein LOC120083935 [Benincasa hispida]